MPDIVLLLLSLLLFNRTFYLLSYCLEFFRFKIICCVAIIPVCLSVHVTDVYDFGRCTCDCRQIFALVRDQENPQQFHVEFVKGAIRTYTSTDR